VDSKIVFNRFLSELEETDLVWFKQVTYNSENYCKHKILVSNDEYFENVIYTDWQNYTIDSKYHKKVEFYIPSTVIEPNSVIYYQVKIFDIKDKIICYSDIISSGNKINNDSPILTELTYSGSERGYDYPWNWCHEVIWDPYTKQFWALTSGEKHFLKKAWTSNIPYDWKYQGVISDDFPNGWISHKGVSGYVIGKDEYVASINVQDVNGTGAVLYTGNNFVNMSLQGFLFKYGENENCSVNCRLNDFWYNSTDDCWYGLISGSSIHKGTRTHVYLAQSNDLNFTDNFDDNPLYYCTQWDNTSWTSSGIYPPNIIWMDGDGFAGVKGYRNHYKPYDFDADLIFVSAPRDISKESFLTELDSEDAYFNGNFKFNDTQRSVPVVQDGIIWMMVRKGVRYDAIGNVFAMTGYWENETVRISPGYNPLYHYSSLPTKEQFTNMLNITIYVWNHEANVTVRQIDMISPEYAKLEIEGTTEDKVIIHIGDATNETMYLHASLIDGVNVLTLTPDPIDSITSIEPSDNKAILFEYILQ